MADAVATAIARRSALIAEAGTGTGKTFAYLVPALLYGGKVIVSTDYPDIGPVMTYAKSESLRRRLYEANVTRAYPENDARLRDLLNLRQELATLLGRKDHATLALEDKMLDHPAKVESLLADMASAAKPASDRDYARKLAIHQIDHPGATRFEPWDSGEYDT